MIGYHGTYHYNLVVRVDSAFEMFHKHGRKSGLMMADEYMRYGKSPILFCTSTKSNAEMYQQYYKQEYGVTNGGLYQLDITPDRVVDFGSESSFSAGFNLLIKRLRAEGVRVARIINVIDYPNSSFKKDWVEGDVIAVFDMRSISHLKKIS